MSTSVVAPPHGIVPYNTISLGFGCGGLLYGLGRSESIKLLETALDCGITYFDTARMYGFGGAEGLLGTIVRRHRDRMVIASKAGILPDSRSMPVRAFDRGVKLLRRVVPLPKDYTPEPSPMRLRFGVFDIPNLRKSLETSLRELRTDHLDIFLLHECTEADLKQEELLDFLRRLQKDGKVRAFGVATGIEETIKIRDARPALSSIVQIASSIWNMNIERLSPRFHGLTITHSTLTGRFHELTRRISSDAQFAKQWESAIQMDPRDKVELARLFLAHAIQANPTGLVLFFSTSQANIRAAASVATDRPFDIDQISRLRTLIGNENFILPLQGIQRDHLSVS